MPESMDRTPEGRLFVRCYDCNGTWLFDSEGYRHTPECPRFKTKPYPPAEQDRDRAEATKEEAACPVHDYSPALECPTCLERGGDLNFWTPASEFG